MNFYDDFAKKKVPEVLIAKRLKIFNKSKSLFTKKGGQLLVSKMLLPTWNLSKFISTFDYNAITFPVFRRLQRVCNFRIGRTFRSAAQWNTLEFIFA